ncbi:M48 family metalloprotease [Dactylosporangium cerinum]
MRPIPVIVKASPRPPGAVVRGWKRGTAVVINVKTAVRWNREPRKRDVQLAHELAHIQAGDHHLYYRSRAFVGHSVACLLLIAYVFHWNGDPVSQVAFFGARVGLLTALTLVVGRAYLRFREHAADVSAASMLGDVSAVQAELPGTMEEPWWNRILGLHPSPGRRRAVVGDPGLLLAADRWSYLLLGASAGLLTSAIEQFLYPLVRAAGGTSERTVIDAAVVVGIVLAVVTPPAVVAHISVVRSPTGVLGRAILLYGSLVAGLLLLNPGQQIPDTVLDPGCWSRVGLVVAIGAAVTTAGALLPGRAATIVLRFVVFASTLAMPITVSRTF